MCKGMIETTPTKAASGKEASPPQPPRLAPSSPADDSLGTEEEEEVVPPRREDEERFPKYSNNVTDRWESPFSKWTPEDWKTREFPTKAQLKAIVPPHCFERSALKGLAFIARDTLILFAGYLFFRYGLGLRTEFPPAADTSSNVFQIFLWTMKWMLWFVVEGGFCGGLWTLGHECGHGAFSTSPFLNDFVGWILHSALLVPYFSWQFSHAKHHRRTNDLIEGETHTPEVWDPRGSAFQQFKYQLFQTIGYHAYAVGDILVHLLLLWPMYLVGFTSGGRKDAKGLDSKGKWLDHYRPTSPLFPDKMRYKVVLSDLGLLITLSICYRFAQIYGYRSVFMWYGLPVISMNNVFLVFVTWMQHTHPTVPHFGATEWTWMKGAIAGTIDRPEPIIDFLAHNIGSTHVCHHLFPEIPHYHAPEATRHLREFLDERGMYNYDPTHQVKAAYLAAKHCHFVPSLEGIQYYQSFESLVKPKKEKEEEQKKKTN